MFAAVTLYAVFAGADFGTGLWDLIAGGAKKGASTRRLIDKTPDEQKCIHTCEHATNREDHASPPGRLLAYLVSQTPSLVRGGRR